MIAECDVYVNGNGLQAEITDRFDIAYSSEALRIPMFRFCGGPEVMLLVWLSGGFGRTAKRRRQTSISSHNQIDH